MRRSTRGATVRAPGSPDTDRGGAFDGQDLGVSADPGDDFEFEREVRVPVRYGTMAVP